MISSIRILDNLNFSLEVMRYFGVLKKIHQEGTDHFTCVAPVLQTFNMRITTAYYRLAKYGLGNELMHAAQTLSLSDFETFLMTWREDLRTVLEHDPEGYLGQKCSAMARAVSLPLRLGSPHTTAPCHPLHTKRVLYDA